MRKRTCFTFVKIKIVKISKNSDEKLYFFNEI